MVGWWRFPHSFQTYTFLPFRGAAILVMLEGKKQFVPKRLEIVPLSHPLGMDQPEQGKQCQKAWLLPWNAKVSCKFAHDPSWEAWKICIMCDIKPAGPPNPWLYSQLRDAKSLVKLLSFWYKLGWFSAVCQSICSVKKPQNGEKSWNKRMVSNMASWKTCYKSCCVLCLICFNGNIGKSYINVGYQWTEKSCDVRQTSEFQRSLAADGFTPSIHWQGLPQTELATP